MTREELQRLTIADLLNSEAYRKRMSQMLDAAWKVEKKRRKEDVNSGRSFIRRLHEHGIENGDQFADVFIAILNKECRLSAFLRREIVEVGSSIARVILGEWQERVERDEGETTTNPSKS